MGGFAGECYGVGAAASHTVYEQSLTRCMSGASVREYAASHTVCERGRVIRCGSGGGGGPGGGGPKPDSRSVPGVFRV